jgi:uncharacterized protein DUF547
MASRCTAILGLLLVASLGQLHPARADAAADLFRSAAAKSMQPVDHGTWDRLLKTYVKPSADGLNRVDYRALKETGRQALKAYIGTLEEIDPRRLDRADQFAVLANLYNAKTLEIVADRYPVGSIKDISLGGSGLGWLTPGPWKAKVTKIGGVALSLDDIEHGILRPIFKDPRVHYALNCASIGCPNLSSDAFVGVHLDAQLEAAARAYVNSDRGVKVQGKGAIVSSIYVWYKGDFGADDRAVLDHLRRYAAPALARQLEQVSSIQDHTYDWALNDASR